MIMQEHPRNLAQVINGWEDLLGLSGSNHNKDNMFTYQKNFE